MLSVMRSGELLCFFFFFEMGFSIKPWLSLDLSMSAKLELDSKRSSCLRIPSAGG